MLLEFLENLEKKVDDYRIDIAMRKGKEGKTLGLKFEMPPIQIIMTKADLIAVIEKQANLSPKQSEKVINIAFDTMIQALFDDERIEITIGKMTFIITRNA